jgi:hypothetical protein
MMIEQQHILSSLRTSAADLTQEVQRLPAEATLWRPAEGEWSQHECLTHLYIAEHFVFLPRLQRLATEDNPLLPVVDEKALQQEQWNPQRPRDDLLAAYLADRQAELELLERVDWSRPGVHETNGPLDIAWVAQYALGHTWEHMSQALRVRLRYALSHRAA